MKTKRLIIFGFMVAVLTPLMGGLLLTGTAYALGPGKWVNQGTITVDGKNYIDNNVADDNHQFHLDGDDDPRKCVNVLKDFNNNDPAKATTVRLVDWHGFFDVPVSSIPPVGLGAASKATCVPKGSAEIVNIDQATVANAKIPPNAKGKSDSCESAGWALAWLVCPVIKALDAAINFLDGQIQKLLEIDKTAYNNPDLYRAWAQIRNVAYIILIPIMLVMVIATALGSDIFSAYTVKKALPRMAAAIMFIAFSWYICSFLVELSNVVGGGLLGLLTNPFNHLVTEAGVTKTVGTAGLSDLFGASQAPIFLVVLKSIGSAVVAIAGMIVIILLFWGPILVFVATAFIILILRQLFVVALLLIAPLAILAWIFPGNDKLWKSWWSAFSKLLIMFPLIIALIAIGRDMAWLVNANRGGGLQGGFVAPVAKIALYILPYAFIPATFKFAGGIFATVSGMAQDRSKGLAGVFKKGRQRKYERAGRQVTQRRADRQVAWQQRASSTTGLRSALYSQASKRIGGYNAQAADAAKRASVKKEVEDQIATGRDAEIRGLTVNKRDADATDAAQQVGTDAQGNAIWDRNLDDRTVLRRTDANGRRQYKSLGGGWVDENAVDQGHKRWGRDTYAQQAALSYEMRKAGTDEEVAGIGERYEALAAQGRGQGGWGMTDTQASGALTGAGFENQNTHLEFKHMRTNGTMNYEAFAKEAYEKKGSYPLAQMSAHTIEQLQEAYNFAGTTGDTETQRRVQAVAEVFMTRYGAGGAPGDPADPATLVATPGVPPGAAAAGVVQTNTPGAASVNEAVRRLAVNVGVYHQLPPPTEDTSVRPNPPTLLQK